MLRLVAYAHDGVRRFPIHRPELVIGSEPSCDIALDYPGVSGRHAKVRQAGGELRIEDLGSRKGTLVNGRRVREAALQVLDEVRLGGITLLVEDVVEPKPEPPVVVAPPAEPTITPAAMLDHVARVSDWVIADSESRHTLESLVRVLLAECGGGALFLFMLQADGTAPGVKLAVATDAAWLKRGETLLDAIDAHRREHPEMPGASFRGAADPELAPDGACVVFRFFAAVERRYLLVVALPRWREESWSPLGGFSALGDLLILGLVHHVGRYEPIVPGYRARKGLTLHPGLVLGESDAMARVIEQLRAAVDVHVPVLLRGEAGTGRELLARSLHLSGSRRDGPFVVASCSGADLQRIEADLFGAEVPGKSGPVEREGKLLLAHGGTLYLHDVEQLPLELQARLVRFLRSGEVEPAGSTRSVTVDVRIVASSSGPLEPEVARDRFRVDLAHRLSGLAIDVPPLRQRREDLPLLIQTYINRCCHEAGKRVQGISVKAMGALVGYHYPGNLTELENLTRQLVYLCPLGQPIDVNLLPPKVSSAEMQAVARVDGASSDLRLDRLVATCEQAAIQEALRRSHHNKSEAARLLGLSRNGLALKMERHGL